MEQILLSKYARKAFFMISGLLLLLLLIIRLIIIPEISFSKEYVDYLTIINTIIDALISTGVSTIFIATLAFWLTPKIVRRSKMDIIDPKEIKDYLELTRNTEEYWFSGGTGRFTRSKTIPKLATDARYSNFSKKMVMILINPDNKIVCENYVAYRNRVRTGTNKKWDMKELKIEIFTTILSAYTWKKEQPLLDITIGLINHYSMFRIDLSTEMVVITKEDKTEPALMCEKDTFFFKSYLEDLRLSLRQSKILDPNIEGIPFNELNGVKVKDLLASFDFDISMLDNNDFNRIVQNIKKGENPYGY